MTVPIASQQQPLAAQLGDFTPKPTSITGGQVEATRSIWSEGGVDTGLWECTPGTFTASRDGYAEICTILSGRVTIETEGSDPVTYVAGDIFVTPSGWKGTWYVAETVRKHYTIIPDEV